jgi:rhodanese-related sulfurtransferase
VQRLSPAEAAKLLESNPSLQLVDIRTKAEIKKTGTPDLRTFKKSLISSTYQPSTPSAAGGNATAGTSTVTIGWPQRLSQISKVIFISFHVDGSLLFLPFLCEFQKHFLMCDK